MEEVAKCVKEWGLDPARCLFNTSAKDQSGVSELFEAVAGNWLEAGGKVDTNRSDRINIDQYGIKPWCSCS